MTIHTLSLLILILSTAGQQDNSALLGILCGIIAIILVGIIIIVSVIFGMAFYKKKVIKKDTNDDKNIEANAIHDYTSVPIVPPKKVLKNLDI